MLGLAFAASTVLLSVPQVERRAWPTPGGWEVVQADTGCGLSNIYRPDGRQPVSILIVPLDDGVGVSLASDDWSVTQGQKYEITYRLGSIEYSALADGWRNSDGRGLMAKFEPAFLDQFAAADGLLVMRGEDVVTNLSLRNSGSGVATLRRCEEHVRRGLAAQARRESQWDYIERDPFAPDPAEPPATPVITNPTWARSASAEFPDIAAAAGLSTGSAELECAVQADGSLSGCTIISEDPVGMGFGQSALAAARRSRLSPRTVDGSPAGARVRWTMRLLLSED